MPVCHCDQCLYHVCLHFREWLCLQLFGPKSLSSASPLVFCAMVAAKRKFVCIAPPRQPPAEQEQGLATNATAEPTAPVVVQRGAPQASQLIISDKPKATAVRTTQPRSAPVICTVFKVGDCAQDLWASAKPDAALFQVQLVHNCKPSLLFSFVASFNDYLKRAHDEDSDIPASISELAPLGMRLSITNEEDPDAVGTFQRWRPAWYIAGDEGSLNNFMALLDAFFVWKNKEMAKEKETDVQIHPHLGINLEEDLEYLGYTFHEPTKSLPLKWYEAHPVMGRRIITLNVEMISETVVNFLFGGQLWAYRSRLDEAGVPSATLTNENSKVHYRLLKDIDCSKEDQKKNALSLFVGVFKNAAMKLVIAKEAAPVSPAAALLSQLREISSLHE